MADIAVNLKRYEYRFKFFNMVVSICLSMLVISCSTMRPIYNQPLKVQQPLSKLPLVPASYKKNDELLVVLTFSGGGKRAAALSYGVMKALKDNKMDTGKSLLSEVDYISSVSGGSYTAAYYGLFGDDMFKNYQKDYLNKRIRYSFLKLISKDGSKLTSNYFHRSDLAAEYYNTAIFKNSTFADILPSSPKIIINATDISTGNSLAFSPKDMRWLCSDLESYPISRAVAASSAVPGAFSPIVLKNYAGCMLPKASQKNVMTSYNHQIALKQHKFLDKKSYPYLHLVDGGVSDNLGVRSALRHIFENNVLQARNDAVKIFQTEKLKKTKKVVFIVVNASDDITPRISQSATEPSLEDVISATSTIQMSRYNSDTLDVLHLKFNDWSQQLKAKCSHSSQCNKINFHIVELNLQQLPKELAKETSLYATALDLPKKQIKTLTDAGYYLLNNSEQFQHFKKSLAVKR